MQHDFRADMRSFQHAKGFGLRETRFQLDNPEELDGTVNRELTRSDNSKGTARLDFTGRPFTTRALALSLQICVSVWQVRSKLFVNSAVDSEKSEFISPELLACKA